MLEAVRKGAWQPGEETVRNLVETYTDLANRFDVVSTNSTFTRFVQTMAVGYGLSVTSGAKQTSASPQPATGRPQARVPAAAAAAPPVLPAAPAPPRVRGQMLKPVTVAQVVEVVLWRYGALILLVVGLGGAWQLWREQGGAPFGGGPFDMSA